MNRFDYRTQWSGEVIIFDNNIGKKILTAENEKIAQTVIDLLNDNVKESVCLI